MDDFAWAPDSKRIALVIHDPDPREPEKKEKEKKTVPPLVIDRLFFKKDMDGYLTERYSHLQLLDLATRKIEPLTSGKHDDLWPAWSPDGKEIAFVTKRGDDPDRTDNWDVWVIGAEPGAKERQLTTSPEADPDPELGQRAGLESRWQNDRLHPWRRPEENRICGPLARHYPGGGWVGENLDRETRSKRCSAALGFRWKINLRDR